MKTTKDLKALYFKELETNSRWRNQPKMQDYCKKQCSVVVELPSGGLYNISKPTIETRFCFSYWTDSTGESYETAQKLAENARRDVDHFMKENLEQIDGWIEELEETKRTGTGRRHAKLFILEHPYNGETEDCKIRDIRFLDDYQCGDTNNEEVRFNWFKTESREATKEDLQALIDGYKEARECFKKRLETYLKRFGLSKVHSWSYDADY